MDQNADCTPGSPLQATILAVQTCRPGFDFTHVDIVTDRGPLRRLLGFVRAEAAAFEFRVSILGKTALFSRVQGETRCPLLSDFHGYRDGFEEQYTKISASAARSVSHHRVVRYDFAGQTILLGYAVDAYLPDLAKTDMQDDDIAAPLVKPYKNMNIKTLPANTTVTARNSGRHIPHAAILELTTRAQLSRAPDSIESNLPEFWISQTLNYHLCLHRERYDGSTRSTIFDCIRIIPMGVLLIGWEEANEEKLRALAHLLEQIVKAAKELGGSCTVSSRGNKEEPLKLTRAKGEQEPALPEDMRSLFLPVRNEAADLPTEQEEAAATARTADRYGGPRKRKPGTEHAPERAGSPPPARRIALDSAFRGPREAAAAVPALDGEVAGTNVCDGTRKRKLDAELLADRPPPCARRRALDGEFRVPPGPRVAVVEEEGPGVGVGDEMVDSEMGAVS